MPVRMTGWPWSVGDTFGIGTGNLDDRVEVGEWACPMPSLDATRSIMTIRLPTTSSSSDQTVAS